MGRLSAVAALGVLLTVAPPIVSAQQPSDDAQALASGESVDEDSIDGDATDKPPDGEDTADADTSTGSSESAAMPSCPDFLKPEDREDAERLTLLGVQCFRSQRYARAYSLYQRAYDISKSTLLQAALGRSLHELGVFHAARNYYRTFLDDGSTSGAGAQKIRERLSQLENDIASEGAELHVSSFPRSARVHLKLPNGDWMNVGTAPVVMVVRQGTWTLKVERPNHRTVTRTVDISKDSEKHSVDVAMIRRNSEFDWTSRQWKRAGMITGISSIPVLAAGGLFFGMTQSTFAEASDYTDDLNIEQAEGTLARAHRYQRTAIVFSSIGAAALVTGTVLWVRGKTLDPKKAQSTGGGTSEKARVVPLVGPARAGVNIRW